MNVLIAGGSGYIGSALARDLRDSGERVSILTRKPTDRSAEPARYHWDPARSTLDREALAGTDAVVNLAGESLAGGRWTQARRRRLQESRVHATRFLVAQIASQTARPRVLVNASACGYYGNRGEEVLVEGSPPGRGFLAELCLAWEEAAAAAASSGVRVAIVRFGLVLGPGGGLLEKMLPVFKLGVGGPLGSGEQWMSWIALADVTGAIRLALGDERVVTPVNAVAPQPVRNRELTKSLGHVLHRPAALPAPAPALKLVFGRMAEEALLSSTRVEARALPGLGYRYRYPDLDHALRVAVAA